MNNGRDFPDSRRLGEGIALDLSLNRDVRGFDSRDAKAKEGEEERPRVELGDAAR